MSNAALSSIVGGFRVLILLVLAGLLVLTIVTWKRYPRTALFVLLGFAAFALGNLVGLATPFLASGIRLADTYGVFLTVVNALASLLDVAGLGLLGVALFLRRPTEEPAQPPAAPSQPPAAPYYGMQPTAPQPSPAGPPPPPPAQPGPGGPMPLWPGNQGQ